MKMPLIALLLLAYTPYSMAQALVHKGYRLGSDSILKDYRLLKIDPTVEHLNKYIKHTNYKVSSSDSLEIATQIILVSRCFSIDPWLFTSLIQKESSFMKEATSPTNAAGLTQFTTLGFQEVNHQLGMKGTKFATEAAINYFNQQINECIDPNWVHLWEKIGVEEDHRHFFNYSKEELKQDIPRAVTYGAVLLKTYLVHIARQNPDISTEEIYFKALQYYNGEDGDAKIRYAKSIFKNLSNLYPEEVSFSFLTN